MLGQLDQREELKCHALQQRSKCIVLFVFVSTGASSQGLVDMKKLSAPLANELVGETVASCAQKGYTVTAIVVDLDGVRQALLRGNGAPIRTLDNALL
jgi:hypothetical protein